MSAHRLPAAADPALEPSVRQTLHALGLAFTPRQIEQLLDYVALLHRWNHVYNLTAVRDAAGIARLQLADCLAALPAFQRAAPRRLLDVGSGGGLPGIVLAVGLPDTDIHLVETVQKKCAFLRQACGSLGLRHVTVHHARVEALHDDAGYDCITSRAFSDLPQFIAATHHLLAAGGQWCAMKGKTPAGEIARLPAGLTSRVEPLQVPGLDAARCLVWVQRSPTAS